MTGAHVAAIAPQVQGREAQGDDGRSGTPTASPPWADFNAQIKEKVIDGLRAVYRDLAKITEYDTGIKRMRHEFAQGMSPAGTLGPIAALARIIKSSLPAEASNKPPGYLTGARVELLKACKKR